MPVRPPTAFPCNEGDKDALGDDEQVVRAPDLDSIGSPRLVFVGGEDAAGDEGRLADYIFLDFRPATLQPFPLTLRTP